MTVHTHADALSIIYQHADIMGYPVECHSDNDQRSTRVTYLGRVGVPDATKHRLESLGVRFVAFCNDLYFAWE